MRSPHTWKLIQRKTSGKDGGLFDKNGWEGYKKGFGNLKAGDFWIGLDYLHYYTTLPKSNWQLLVKYLFKEGGSVIVIYNGFRVESEMEEYRLRIGNLYDAYGSLSKWKKWYNKLTLHNGAPFSTKDRDNDAEGKENCAQTYHGGFWFQPTEKYSTSCIPFDPPTTTAISNAKEAYMAIRRIDQ